MLQNLQRYDFKLRLVIRSFYSCQAIVGKNVVQIEQKKERTLSNELLRFSRSNCETVLCTKVSCLVSRVRSFPQHLNHCNISHFKVLRFVLTWHSFLCFATHKEVKATKSHYEGKRWLHASLKEEKLLLLFFRFLFRLSCRVDNFLGHFLCISPIEWWYFFHPFLVFPTFCFSTQCAHTDAHNIFLLFNRTWKHGSKKKDDERKSESCCYLSRRIISTWLRCECFPFSVQ